jgi:hypothetical protein
MALTCKLPLFIVPPALFNSVKENLEKTQMQNFGQEVNAIDIKREQLTLKNLEWLEKELKKSKRKKKLVLMKVDMIQSLGLEFVHQLKAYSDCKGEGGKLEIGKKNRKIEKHPQYF